MSTISEQSRRVSPPSAIPIARIVRRWWQALLDWNAERAAITQLSSMSDYELRDMGLRRSDIAEAVKRHPAGSRRGF